MISIVTLWLNAPELIPMYETVTGQGAQIVIVDNGSTVENGAIIQAFCERIGAEYIRNEENEGFCKANNRGLAKATGDIIVFMNNDIKCQPAFLPSIEREVQNGALYGPSLLNKHGWDYLEGWCIAARREVWEALGGWDEQLFQGFYWEDNDLCFRAQKLGFKLVQTYWPLWHLSNYTTKREPRSYDYVSENELKFVDRIRTWPS